MPGEAYVWIEVNIFPSETDGSSCCKCGDPIFLNQTSLMFRFVGFDEWYPLTDGEGEQYSFCQSCGEEVERIYEGES